MGFQAGAQGGRRLTDAKQPANEDLGERVPKNAVAPTKLEEQNDQQHVHHTPRERLDSLPSGPMGVTTTIHTIPSKEESKGTSSNSASRSVSREPPITKATLSELDVHRIVFNPKLRHDINFDPDLHFRPNLDGDKGRRKVRKVNEFWDSLRGQLEAFMKDQPSFLAEHRGQTWCLPLTLHAIKEILVTLVPPEDRGVVEEILNVDLLMQQFSKGVADLEKLANWLSRTLKSHCAPMRDEWVDEMVIQLSKGNLNRDISLLVEGLHTLLGILEAMKLDVANHQIRCLRPLLIQDTVEFEQTFFMKKIAMRKLDVKSAYTFYQTARSEQGSSAGPLSSWQRDLWAFFQGFVRLLLPSKSVTKIPDTFMFDEERIIKLRSEILDAISLDICMRLFRDEAQRAHEPTTPSTPSISSGSDSSFSRCASPISRRSSPSPSLHLREEPRRKIYSETARSQSPFAEDPLCHSDGECADLGSRALFPSSSTAVSCTKTPTLVIMPLSSETPPIASENFVRQSILALVDDTQGSDRWQQSCPAIALEILRSTHGQNLILPTESKTSLEADLSSHLENIGAAFFQVSQSSVHSDLLSLLDDVVTSYTHKSSVQLFEIASTPRPVSSQSTSPCATLREVAKQVAHIGILHWRVWAQLVYLMNPETDETIANADDRTLHASPEARTHNPSHHLSPAVANDRSRSLGTQTSVYGI